MTQREPHNRAGWLAGRLACLPDCSPAGLCWRLGCPARPGSPGRCWCARPTGGQSCPEGGGCGGRQEGQGQRQVGGSLACAPAGARTRAAVDVAGLGGWRSICRPLACRLRMMLRTGVHEWVGACAVQRVARTRLQLIGAMGGHRLLCPPMCACTLQVGPSPPRPPATRRPPPSPPPHPAPPPFHRPSTPSLSLAPCRASLPSTHPPTNPYRRAAPHLRRRHEGVVLWGHAHAVDLQRAGRERGGERARQGRAHESGKARKPNRTAVPYKTRAAAAAAECDSAGYAAAADVRARHGGPPSYRLQFF